MSTNPHRAFIKEKLGGAEEAAERLHRTPGAIRMWAHRRAVPRSMWPEILDAYQNVTLEDLKALERAWAA
jgi:hypothetical protein